MQGWRACKGVQRAFPMLRDVSHLNIGNGCNTVNSPVMPKLLFLASQSPRRLELLRQIGLDPTVLPLRVAPGRCEVDETPLPDEVASEYVSRLARMKLAAALRARGARNLPPWPIVAADTTVTVDGLLLGKPLDAEDAAAMLRRYAGRTHVVLTAVAAAYQGREGLAVSESAVTFAPLDEQAIGAYLAHAEYVGKAGGYAIQGRAAMFVSRIEGSFSGVVGLPLFETAQLLRSVGFDPS